MTGHQLDRTQARRVAVRAQMLDAVRPTGLVDVVEQLTFLQIDPTAAIAPNADLVLWTRLGSSYRPDHLKSAVEENRLLYEHNALIRPMSDLGLYLAEMESWPTREASRRWLEVNDSFRHDVLDLLGSSGPLLSRDIPDASVEQWRSSGWTNARNVTQMLEFLMMRGEVAIAGRQGRQRIWDLADRIYPSGVDVVPREDALRMRAERRLQSLGIARASGPQQPIEPYVVGEVGEPAIVEGVEGEWRVDPAALDDTFAGRTALLSPFDRLVHDRVRARELFGFEYVLEMYKPKEQRRWGYFALPILHHDRLVGKLDTKVDRKAGVLEVFAIHEDIPFDRTIRLSVESEIDALAGWLDVKRLGP